MGPKMLSVKLYVFPQVPQLMSGGAGPKPRQIIRIPSPPCQAQSQNASERPQLDRTSVVHHAPPGLQSHSRFLHLVSVFGDNHFIEVNLL